MSNDKINQVLCYVRTHGLKIYVLESLNRQFHRNQQQICYRVQEGDGGKVERAGFKD